MKILPDEFSIPQRTLTGAATVKGLLPRAREFGGRGMLVHGSSLRRSGFMDGIIGGKPGDLEVVTFQYDGGEPTLQDVEKLRRAARENGVDWLAGVGGGSVMDTAKVAAGMYNSQLSVEEHHQGDKLDVTGIPFLAVPTTAGTGSEATTVSVLIDSQRELKKSVRHPSYMARFVILDPDLLSTCPPQVIAYSGLDALAQGVESYISRGATWLSREFSGKSVELISGSLEKVFHGAEANAAHDLLVGSYLAGIGLSMARLGVIHGLVHPLGVRYDLPHGLLCGVALPHAVEFNRTAMGKDYEELSNLVGGDLLEVIECLRESLAVDSSPLSGRELSDREDIVRETLASGSTKANPEPVSEEDVEWLLNRLFT